MSALGGKQTLQIVFQKLTALPTASETGHSAAGIDRPPIAGDPLHPGP